MKITLKDIAEETGYSISTVSRVLNGSNKISNKARRKIYNSARRLDYPIHHTLNGEKVVATLKLFFVITGFHIGEFYASMFNGINNAAENHNVQISMISMRKPFDEMLHAIKELSQQHYDGMILFAPEFKRKDYVKIVEELPNDFPLVSNALIENPVISTVTFDNYSGGFSAGEHFKRQGYQRCGVIKGPFKKTEARYRSNGFRDYILQAPGMELCWEHQGDFTFKSGTQAFESFLEKEHKPRAIFAANDEMGHAFLERALEYGLRVPEDLALISYDDLPICVRHRPKISSVHTNYEKLGIVTMEKIKELITNPSQQKGVLSLVPVSLKVRETS
ncbi:MAG TPA: LacI family DNA-binding transcriptional regulator [Balneolaceae bacterium]|nr:LacI family DNA-binding transcriptional regulator [Balneolaceae bacterium]